MSLRRFLLLFALVLLAPLAAAADDHEKHMHMHGGQMDGGMGAAAAPVAPDARQAIVLSEDERNFVLTEMRGFLDSVQGIIDGVASDNMKAVAEAARSSGMITMQRAPQSLMSKMPPEFRMLGMSTHVSFGKLAEEASAMGDKQQILKQLGGLMANCGACHQGYRLTVQ